MKNRGTCAGRFSSVEKAHDLNGNQRSQSDQSNHSEGVSDNIAADCTAGTHCKGQQEGGGHGTAGHAAGVEGNSDEDGGNEEAHDQGCGIAGNENPVDADARQNANHGKRCRAGNTCLKSTVHGGVRNHSAGEILDLLVENLNGGLGPDNREADEDADWNQNPGVLVAPKAAAKEISDRSKADVDAGQKQDQSQNGIHKADQHTKNLMRRVGPSKKLKQREYTDNGERTLKNLTDIVREGLHKFQGDILRGKNRRKLDRVVGGFGWMIEDAEQHDHQNRSDAAERDETEAVIRVVPGAQNGRKADAEGHDKGNGHGSCGDAAGIKGNGKKIIRNKDRQKEQQKVENRQHTAERNPVQNAQNRNRGKNTYACSDRPDEDRIGNGSDLIGKDLQIRLRDGDDCTHEKTDQKNEWLALAADNSAADSLTERRHGEFSTQLEQSHSKDQQEGAGQKQRDGADFHGNQCEAENQYNCGDRKDAGKRFSCFFF